MWTDRWSYWHICVRSHGKTLYLMNGRWFMRTVNWNVNFFCIEKWLTYPRWSTFFWKFPSQISHYKAKLTGFNFLFAAITHSRNSLFNINFGKCLCDVSANAHIPECELMWENDPTCAPFSSHDNNSHDYTILSTQSNRHFHDKCLPKKNHNQPMLRWFLFSIFFFSLYAHQLDRSHHHLDRFCVYILDQAEYSNSTHHHYKLTRTIAS